MKYEICSRYIYKEMRVTPDQGHDEASFSTKKHTLNNKDESNEATIGIPLPHHKQQCRVHRHWRAYCQMSEEITAFSLRQDIDWG